MKNRLIIIITAFLQIQIQAAMQSTGRYTPRSIQANPIALLETNYRLLANFARFLREKSNNFNLCSQQAIQYINEVAKENPIFMLWECYTDTCPLSRSVSPTTRKNYTSFMAQRIATMKTSTNPVEYVSFASGSLAQDFFIINEALLNNPELSVSVRCIDLYYKLDINKDTTEFLKAIIRIHQIETYFKRHFPKSNVSFTIYHSADSYSEAVKKNALQKPDIMGVIDIEDESAIEGKAFECFYHLYSTLYTTNNSLQAFVCLSEPGTRTKLWRIIPNSDNMQLVKTLA